MNLLDPRGQVDITEAEISKVVHAFYERVQHDAELGPVFGAAVHDWPEHLTKLTSFWSTILRTTGSYKGNPMVVHRKLGSEQVTPERFARWLALWKLTTNELLSPEAAARMQERAGRMAVNLQQAVGVTAPRS